MHKSSSYKAQFFILATLIIVISLFFLSRWIQPFLIIDISRVILKEEIFVFNNLKEKSLEIVKTAKSCEELKFNLEEFKIFAERFCGKKGFSLEFNYTFSCETFPVNILFSMNLTSEEMRLESTYSATWPS